MIDDRSDTRKTNLISSMLQKLRLRSEGTLVTKAAVSAYCCFYVSFSGIKNSEIPRLWFLKDKFVPRNLYCKMAQCGEALFIPLSREAAFIVYA